MRVFKAQEFEQVEKFWTEKGKDVRQKKEKVLQSLFQKKKQQKKKRKNKEKKKKKSEINQGKGTKN